MVLGMSKFLHTFFVICLTLSAVLVEAKIPVFVWTSFNPKASDNDIKKELEGYKSSGVTGVCVGAGWSVKNTTRFSTLAHECGLEYHAWIPMMLQGGQDSTLYTVNRLGQSAYDHPVYVPYYRTLDPNKPEVADFLIKRLEAIADIPSVDYIQLDYIRYADVILAKGLWHKYNLVMDEEYPAADYCYCDKCVADFKAKTGIDIRSVKDPSKCKKWADFRCDILTAFVNKLAKAIHDKGKKVSADVFPGPYSYAKWMVRQEWNNWDVDAFFPMNYNDFYLEPASWVGKITREEVKSLKNPEQKIYSGLFICNRWEIKASIKDPEGHGLSPAELKEAIEDAMQAGATGVCLFSAHSMTKDHWDTIKFLD